MATLKISLPDDANELIRKRISGGEFADASEYVLNLIRADQKRAAQNRLEDKLLEGLKGPVTEMTRRDWSDVRREVAKRVAVQPKNRKVG